MTAHGSERPCLPQRRARAQRRDADPSTTFEQVSDRPSSFSVVGSVVVGRSAGLADPHGRAWEAWSAKFGWGAPGVNSRPFRARRPTSPPPPQPIPSSPSIPSPHSARCPPPSHSGPAPLAPPPFVPPFTRQIRAAKVPTTSSPSLNGSEEWISVDKMSTDHANVQHFIGASLLLALYHRAGAAVGLSSSSSEEAAGSSASKGSARRRGPLAWAIGEGRRPPLGARAARKRDAGVAPSSLPRHRAHLSITARACSHIAPCCPLARTDH